MDLKDAYRIVPVHPMTNTSPSHGFAQLLRYSQPWQMHLHKTSTAKGLDMSCITLTIFFWWVHQARGGLHSSWHRIWYLQAPGGTSSVEQDRGRPLALRF